MKTALYFRFYVASAERLRAWALGAWRSLPEPLQIRWFGDGERPKRQPQYSTQNTAGLNEYLLRERPGYSLFGDRLWYYISLTNQRRVWSNGINRVVHADSELQVYAQEHPEVVNTVRSLFLALASHDVVYAYGGMSAEIERRNMYEIAVRGTPAASMTGWMGRDHTRYVSGLYWLNYFSRGYLEEHAIRVDRISAQLGGTIERVPEGLLLQLYEKPQDWRDADRKVSDVIRHTPGMFSMDKIAIPESLTLREEITWNSAVARQWP